ncbi:M24 family metallopeptidase [Kordiimonas lipolytica]|uniref:M24 family metallopeptidase n=1 Tax=Kordiimonas lipolytica TaxID=1662421 RepID=A0ABV8UG16_9PROT|nr:Xaa-Pro peptidase family protein [Kordiimonas lipolytica]
MFGALNGKGNAMEGELSRLRSLRLPDLPTVPQDEFAQRIKKACQLMAESGISAVFLNAGPNLAYFTGIELFSRERLLGALLNQSGDLCFFVPSFELGTFSEFGYQSGEVRCWEEHESPYIGLADWFLKKSAGSSGVLAVDERTPFFHVSEIQSSLPGVKLVNAKSITATCRMIKSESELACIQAAMNMTLEVQQSCRSVLDCGLEAGELKAFIDAAHKAIGAKQGSYFCSVLFGDASSYPHGVRCQQVLREGDVVLIDTGCQVAGYKSDITRTYVFGEPTSYQREIWKTEQEAQMAGFKAAAQPGAKCSDVDLAVRNFLEARGLGPGYELPGLPHRTGHGIGLEIHEWPYLNLADTTALQEGMCFSCEPTICVPGKFGMRLEDHFFMSTDGPTWFTQPSPSIDSPFFC